MKRLALVLVSCVLMHAMSAAPAEAHIWRWVQEMSGPGPFWGVTAEFRLKCWGRKPLPSDVERLGGPVVGVKFPCPKEDQDEDPAARANRDNEYNTYSVNVEAGWLVAGKGDNPIAYDDNVARSVYLFPVEAFLYWQPVLGLELGAGGGVFVFHHQDLYTFSRLVLEPRIDFRPADFALRKSRTKYGVGWGLLRGITLRHSQVFYPQRITAQDFKGSRADSFNERGEFLKSFSVLMDFDPLMRKKRTKGADGIYR